MRILLIVPELFFSEPLGLLQISAACRAVGHTTRLCALSRDSIAKVLDDFQPDLVGYSVMTPNEPAFAAANAEVLDYQKRTGRRVYRIMGGPHPTFFPEVIDKIDLDAIVIGPGDHAIQRILGRIAEGGDLDGLPNVMTPTFRTPEREIINDPDALPFADRGILYDYDPSLRNVGIRTFMTQRGCPYKCTYCFNHAFNKMFKGGGRKLMARRSVDSLLAEIKHVAATYPKLRYVQFSDSVFTLQKDEWLEEFAHRYPREIGLPFMCCVQPQDMRADVLDALKTAGCRAISTSIESGVEQVRIDVLKRPLPDGPLRDAFRRARQTGIRVQNNTMLALPGTSLEDDFRSIAFTRECAPDLATFGIFTPFPKTDLRSYAESLGLLTDASDVNVMYKDRSVMNNYSDDEKKMQVRLTYIAPLLCNAPSWMFRSIRFLSRLPLDGLYRYINSIYTPLIYGRVIFAGAGPSNLSEFVSAAWYAFRYYLKWK